MKEYFEVRIPTGDAGIEAGVIIAGLTKLGFEGFVEEEGRVLTYMERDDRSPEAFATWLASSGFKGAVVGLIADRNWNEQWERDYRPVRIGNSIMVRAPFHEPDPGIRYDIVIEPRMAFGTAHHETTAMMLDLIVQMDVKGKQVLDMGCGTAVLAILAHRMGAAGVLAVDNDEWAFNNASDNARLNGAGTIEVVLGDAGAAGNRLFDIIFANINRNILMQDIPRYAASLNSGGKLLMSGFYRRDLPMIREIALGHGLRQEKEINKNDWTAALFIST
jgi:ribosomal protein L11 methyltransferase